MNKNLNWQHIKALHKLYEGGSVNKGSDNSPNSLRNHPYFNFLYSEGCIIDKARNNKIYIKEQINYKYDKFYEEVFKNIKGEFYYDLYLSFLEELEINTNTSRLTEYDILKLIDIKEFWNNEDLQDLRNQIIAAKENIQGVSLIFFKSSKYLTGRQSLISAVEKLIGVDLSIENETQYLKPFNCKHPKPKITILCENFYFLKFPYYIENYEVELLYVGGYNVNKLKNLIDVKYPIYYLGDWDYDGLIIYEKAKNIIDKLENNKEHQLQLITPNLKPNLKPVKLSETEENHKSIWKNKEQYICGLKADYYNSEQQNLIKDLSDKDEWIEEEGNNLEQIIKTLIKKNKLNRVVSSTRRSVLPSRIKPGLRP